MDGEEASDESPATLDSLDRKTAGSTYNIPFADIGHAVFAANENVEFPKDRNLIKKAEDYRNLGNESFKRGFLESAIDYYTKAIKTYPYNHEFYTNRALCYKKQRKWDCVSEAHAQVEQDVRQALNLEENSVKAHYYLGQALLNLGTRGSPAGNPVEGMRKLRKAKCLSEHYKVPYSEEIDNEILKARKAIWEAEDERLGAALDSFRQFVSVGLAHAQDTLERSRAVGELGDEGYADRVQQLELFTSFIANAREKNVPTYLCCKISMVGGAHAQCLMRDPVISPSGLTYERSLLETHILSNGEYDPVTR